MTFANQMNIVFFADAVVHVTRIGRVLRQPRGNAMLVGVGGSGKQSLTRVASFVAGYDCVQIEINRGYGLMEFREDIKKLMVSGKNCISESKSQWTSFKAMTGSFLVAVPP